MHRLSSASTTSARLPTAAVLQALLLSASLLGCGARDQDSIASDQARGARAASSTSSTEGSFVSSTASTASTQGVAQPVDPEPHALPGEPAIVVPPTPTTSAVSIATAPSAPKPIPHVKTAGVKPRVHPSMLTPPCPGSRSAVSPSTTGASPASGGSTGALHP